MEMYGFDSENAIGADVHVIYRLPTTTMQLGNN